MRSIRLAFCIRYLRSECYLELILTLQELSMNVLENRKKCILDYFSLLEYISCVIFMT